ncbi:MAG TPA: ABC transporter permease [Anaerolineales bacterium]|nr:ABC transporter permease [Anaerolineae bacterium]HIQ02611.1 ABC transporter permease [Anaerolineales bacterium]
MVTTFKEALRSFRTATWLGWQIESNWTDPFLFTVYSIVKPVAGAMILVLMYTVVSGGGRTGDPMFAYIFLGNGFYIYVGSVLMGVSWAVIDDREHYQTLKYLYASPVRMVPYLMGRAMARLLTGTLSVLITLLFGVLFLHIPLRVEAVDWPLLVAAMGLGLPALAFLGLVLAGITLRTARHAWMMGEAVAGALYLFSGAIFPLTLLPRFLQPLGYVMPLTYWLELVRRALLAETAAEFSFLGSLSNGQLLVILAGITGVTAGVGLGLFRWCEHVARERGLFDRETHH